MEGLSGGIIVAIVDFLMVFTVLGGLAGLLIGMRHVLQGIEKKPQPAAPSSEKAAKALEKKTLPDSQEHQTLTHLAAISAAIQEFTSLEPGTFQIDFIESLEYTPLKTEDTHIAAITAAVTEYTELPEGSFHIKSIEPISADLSGRQQLQTSMHPHIVAMASALHEYLATPPGSFRIVSVTPGGPVNTWKMAGRLEIMGLDNE